MCSSATRGCSTTAAGRGSAAWSWRPTRGDGAWPTSWCARRWSCIGDREVRLDAQTGLRDWYASYGFEVSGPEFDEDGVFHVPMRREPKG